MLEEVYQLRVLKCYNCSRNMKNNTSLAYACILIIGDFLALLAAFSAAYILRVKLDPRPLLAPIPATTYFLAFASVLPLWILVHAAIGLYNQAVYERRFVELGRLLVGSFIGILVVIGYDFVVQDNIFPARLVPIYGLGIGIWFLGAISHHGQFFTASIIQFWLRREQRADYWRHAGNA